MKMEIIQTILKIQEILIIPKVLETMIKKIIIIGEEVEEEEDINSSTKLFYSKT